MVRNRELLIFAYRDRRIFIAKSASYESAVKTASLKFNIPISNVILETDEVDVCDGDSVEITESTWEPVVKSVNKITVCQHASSQGNATVASASYSQQVARTNSAVLYQFKIYIRTPEGKTVVIKHAAPFMTVEGVKSRIMDGLGIPTDMQRLIYNGRQLEDDSTLSDCNIRAESTLHLVKRQVGGKPVIYVKSPNEIDVSVSLSLTKDWTFSAIYPVVSAKPRFPEGGQTVKWSVRTSRDGTLFEKTTGVSVSYLYWEAETSACMDTPPASPSTESSVQVFSPLSAKLSDEDSVLLNLQDLPSYLDAALTGLGLDTEAKTDFITYWLPSFNKHPHIALRFVPQASYEYAAPLEVSPKPDVLTRLFMLFGGVKTDELPRWKASIDRAKENVQMWQNVIGIDLEKVRDHRLFSVLEWGGMEVVNIQKNIW